MPDGANCWHSPSTSACPRTSGVTKLRFNNDNGNSNLLGKSEPTALICKCSWVGTSSKTGPAPISIVVAMLMMSDSSRTFSIDDISNSTSPANGWQRCSNEAIVAKSVSKQQTCSTSNTRVSACNCVTAWAPQPINPTTRLSGLARNRLATADAAPVRNAVSSVPSTTASNWPVVALYKLKSERMVGRPLRSGF